MTGGQNDQQNKKMNGQQANQMNPELILEIKEERVDGFQNKAYQELILKNDQQEMQNNLEMQIELQANLNHMDHDQERPSPIDESYSNSNNSKGKNKPPPLSNELLKLTKKVTTTCKRQKKVRYYVTDFQPYLPTFLDIMHRQHYKNIIRIGQQYQATIEPYPKFQSIRRPMDHLRVWKGDDEPFDEEVYKKFKEIFGDYRTEEQLILLKNRLKAGTWADVMRQLNQQKQQGKRPTLHIPNNPMNNHSTRIK